MAAAVKTAAAELSRQLGYRGDLTAR